MRRRAALFGLLLGALGCHANTALVEVAISNIPLDARKLLLSVRLGGDVADQLSPVDLPAGAGQSFQTLALRLPTTEGLPQSLVVGAGVVNAADCPLSAGLAQSTYEQRAMMMQLALQPQPQPTPRATGCTLQQPFVFGVTPGRASTTGGTPVSIHGWGFDQKARVYFDTTLPVDAPTWSSPNELTGHVPRAPGRYGYTPVRVENPDDSYADNASTFAYYSAPDQLQLIDQDCVAAPGGGSAHWLFAVGPFLKGSAAPGLLRIDQESGRTEVFAAPIDGKTAAAVSVQDLGVTPLAAAVSTPDPGAPVDLVLTTNGDGGILLFANHGAASPFLPGLVSRTFVDLAPAAATSVQRSAAAAADLAVADSVFDEVNILFRQTDGGFQRRDRISLPVPREPVSVLAADVNGDQQADLVVGHRSENLISLLVQGPTGRAAPWAGPFMPLSVPGPYHSLTVGDVDGNGTADLIFATDQTSKGATTSTLYVYYLDPGNAPASSGSAMIDGLPQITSLLGVDLDGNGTSEIAVGFAQSASLQVYARVAGGPLTAVTGIVATATNVQPVTTLLPLFQDLYHRVHLVAANAATGAVACWKNTSL
jgi:hypothetical protein